MKIQGVKLRDLVSIYTLLSPSYKFVWLVKLTTSNGCPFILEIVFTIAAPAFDILFIGCVLIQRLRIRLLRN